MQAGGRRFDPDRLHQFYPWIVTCAHEDLKRPGAEAGGVFFDKLDVASVLRRMSMTCREAKAKQRELLLFEVISRNHSRYTYLPRRLGVIWSSE